VWDRDRLEQVLSNLIGNALAYGDPATPVTIDARAEGGQVTIVVHNHGPPISEALQAKLFDPFRRGERESRTSNTDGLGLGLYITNEIVRAHGGTISVRSNAADGTTFCVTLPHNPAAAGGEPP
jgi:signal transduction histidine kinase